MIEFHRLALNELRRAQAWYRKKSLLAAERFFEQTSRALERLQVDPSSYPMIGRKCHCLRIPKFPFVLIYHIRSKNDLLVVAVAHTSRRHDYWRNRK